MTPLPLIALAPLRRHLPASVAQWPVALPGRGARLRVPYALFGHSLGGMLAHALQAQGKGAPRALCVAAARAPSQQPARPQHRTFGCGAPGAAAKSGRCSEWLELISGCPRMPQARA